MGELGLELADPAIALGLRVLGLPPAARQPLGQLLGAPLRQPQRLGMGAVVATHEVGEHVDLAEDPHPQIRRDMGVGEERPVGCGDLAFLAELVPQGRQVLGAGRGADPAQRPGEAVVQHLGDQARHDPRLGRLADQDTVQAVVLGVGVEGELGTADDLAGSAGAQAGADDRAMKAMLELMQAQATPLVAGGAVGGKVLGKHDARRHRDHSCLLTG